MQFPMGPACIFLRKGIAEKQKERPLGEDEIEELWEAFFEFDKDRDGFISCKDLGNLMRTMGYMPTEMQLTELGQQIRMNLGGCVDIDDFVELMIPKLLAETAGMIGVQEMQDAFKEQMTPCLNQKLHGSRDVPSNTAATSILWPLNVA